MLDRQKVEAVLMCRFPGASDQQVAAAANEIMGLSVARSAAETPDFGDGHPASAGTAGVSTAAWRATDPCGEEDEA